MAAGPRAGTGLDAVVGARIALRRTALGLSQTALATRLGISFQQVQKYERGTNRISASRLHAVAAVLGMPIVDFFPQTAAANSQEMIDADWPAGSATTEGQAVAAGFPLIPDRALRQAVATIVQALATPTV
jgi:transcriptional regulator with XRE-family HTH domain